MTKEEKVEMFRMRLEGKTLQEIGNKYGITRERVRQILLHGSREVKINKRCIYKKLSEDMKKNNITVEKIGEIMGVSRTSAFCKLKGEKPLKINEIKKILKFTGMTFEECFATEEDNQWNYTW